tara:strand:- start:50553 stop:50972 length:420 start_codon:yes stop_codon:yes gene_type:complete
MRVEYTTVRNELEGLGESEFYSAALSILELDAIWEGISSTGQETTLLPDLGILADLLTTLTAIRDMLTSRVTDSDKLLEEVYTAHSLYYKVLKKIRDLENFIDLFTPVKEKNFSKELNKVEVEKEHSSATLKMLALIGD